MAGICLFDCKIYTNLRTYTFAQVSGRKALGYDFWAIATNVYICTQIH